MYFGTVKKNHSNIAQVFFPIWGGRTTTETRLVVTSNEERVYCYFAVPSFERYRELTATKWYTTTVIMASAPRPFARLYNVL